MSPLMTFSAALFWAWIFPLVVASPLPSPVRVNGTNMASLNRSGRGTWFDVGLGNCGEWDTNDHPIVAIGKGLYDRNQASNCGQWVTINNNENGHVAHGLVRDSCPSCSDNDLDMSPSLFEKLARLDEGVLKITWHFEAKGWSP